MDVGFLGVDLAILTLGKGSQELFDCILPLLRRSLPWAIDPSGFASNHALIKMAQKDGSDLEKRQSQEYGPDRVA